MGMFDYIVVLDEILRCPHDHRVDEFQTKSFDDPAMETYLFDGPRVYRVARDRFDDSREAAAEHWKLNGNEAVFRRRHPAEPVAPPREVVFYVTCEECRPVLVRRERPRVWGELVEEHLLWVEFRATFAPGEPRYIERVSGTRNDLAAELRAEGLRVLRDEEPLAIAHQEIHAAREEAGSRSSRRGWR
jgi:hypothetical protein